MMLSCSICGAPVLRKDCHRNRYREYICRDCQADGIRFSWSSRLRHHWRQATTPIWAMLGLAATVLLLAWLSELMGLLQPKWLFG